MWGENDWGEYCPFMYFFYELVISFVNNLEDVRVGDGTFFDMTRSIWFLSFYPGRERTGITFEIFFFEGWKIHQPVVYFLHYFFMHVKIFNSEYF